VVVIDDFDLARPRVAFRPFKANPPLVVDANTVLPLTIAFERFQPGARKAAQRLQVRGSLQPVKTFLRLPAERLEGWNMLALGERACSFVPELRIMWACAEKDALRQA
jgi:hypothetical protein